MCFAVLFIVSFLSFFFRFQFLQTIDLSRLFCNFMVLTVIFTFVMMRGNTEWNGSMFLYTQDLALSHSGSGTFKNTTLLPVARPVILQELKR